MDTDRKMTDPPNPAHRRPDGTTDETVAAVGKLSEAFEWIERARGRLYDFHQMMGRADLLMGEAANMLDEAGHGDESDRVRREIVGRNVLHGRWTFQVIEDFDDGYYRPAAEVDDWVHDRLMDGNRHVFEAELKEQRRSPGMPGHESHP